MERSVRKHVQAIVTRCKTTGEKFADADFGPTAVHPTGAQSLYGNPPKKPGAVGSTQYPEPDALRWDRPMYVTTTTTTTTTTTFTITSTSTTTGSRGLDDGGEVADPTLR